VVKARSTDTNRINARSNDVFDVFNLRYYLGPNPYLEARSLVFDFGLTQDNQPLSIERYAKFIGNYYPHLENQGYDSYATLFARVVVEVGKLNVGLYLNRWSIQQFPQYERIAIQSLHEQTTRAIVYFVWDWLEAVTQDAEFDLEPRLKQLHHIFHKSVYGGSSTYSLLQTADFLDIPNFYLWTEGLVQYGYGKKQVRGIGTSFDCDSHLDVQLTNRRDDCREFLENLGFPVPEGDTVTSVKAALALAKELGYPVAVKPALANKRNGVNPYVQNERELESAYEAALLVIPANKPRRIIVEKRASGSDFRLLCVNSKFIAVAELRPASVIGDGYSTIAELIEEENNQLQRQDGFTSSLNKIQIDQEMKLHLRELGLKLDSVLEEDVSISLRKVANLASGDLSINVTNTIHNDNVILAQEICQYFRLTCVGIDAIAENLSKSWKSGNFYILGINASPGIHLHLRPALGGSTNVPAHILKKFFHPATDAKIPIITFNQISGSDMEIVVNHILRQRPNWKIGAVCRDGVFINRLQKVVNQDYNSNVQTLLRHPQLDLLIAEYPENILESEGMFYQGSQLVILDNPSETEMMLMRNTVNNAIVIVRKESEVLIHSPGLTENYQLILEQSFISVYLSEINSIL